MPLVEPCASPIHFRCRFDPPGPNSWAQTLFKTLHLWVGGRVSTSAQWRESLGSGLLMKAADGAFTSALTKLCIVTQEFIQNRMAGQRPVNYRGQVLTPRLLRRTGNCPPPTRRQLQAQPGNSACGTASRRAGQQPRHVRIMSWNAGHLGQQQWGEIKTWLADEADQYCDVLILQETHWTATAEFTVSGWYCVSSASPTESCPKPKQGSRCKSRKDTQDGPSTTVADGVMVFYSKFDRQRIWWKEWLQGRVLEDITGK